MNSKQCSEAVPNGSWLLILLRPGTLRRRMALTGRLKGEASPLPEGMVDSLLDIKVSLSRLFKFPNNSEQVSTALECLFNLLDKYKKL